MENKNKITLIIVAVAVAIAAVAIVFMANQSPVETVPTPNVTVDGGNIPSTQEPIGAATDNRPSVKPEVDKDPVSNPTVNYTNSNTEYDYNTEYTGVVVKKEKDTTATEPAGSSTVSGEVGEAAEPNGSDAGTGSEVTEPSNIEISNEIKMEAHVKYEDGSTWVVPYFFNNLGEIVNSDGKPVTIENLTNDKGQIVYGDKLLTKDNELIKNPDYVEYAEKQTHIEMKYDASGMWIGEESYVVEPDNSKATIMVYASPYIYEEVEILPIVSGDGWTMNYGGITEGLIRLVLNAPDETVLTISFLNPDGSYTEYKHTGSGTMAFTKSSYDKSIVITVYAEIFKNGNFVSSEAHNSISIPVGG